MAEKISIPMNDGFSIVAEKSLDNKEMYIYLESRRGVVWQDIAMVRAPGAPEDPSDSRCKVFVWADKHNEDYTNEFAIGIFSDYEEDC